MLDSWYPLFKLDPLNSFIVLAIILFSVLTLVYSYGFMRGRQRLAQYYIGIILTALASIGAVLANHLVLLLVFWGFLSIILYLLVNLGEDKKASIAAKKALIIVGGSDALMVLGIGIIYALTNSCQMDKIRIPLSGEFAYPLSVVAYLCLAAACFAKAGAMPLHSWIPDCAESAPLPVAAYLPASLDKLLGIYLLARISLHLFVMSPAMNIMLMFIGAFTIIAGVMMALVQHDIRRLLGYHAVSQVGYMVLGIGTGTPLGIAGGLFHMLNNAIYKSCLFLTGGNVQQQTKTSDLGKLGGLAKVMPLTYACALIASLSISGVPPFNGFVSKWMVYQGLIQNLSGSASQQVAGMICLAAAMAGSGLTLASFMKLMHAVFMGQRLGKTPETAKEVSVSMWLPCLILSGLCIIFGIFASSLPLKYFIFPPLMAYPPMSILSPWQPSLSTALIAIGLILGVIVFLAAKLKSCVRQDKAFVGCEVRALQEDSNVTGVDFYNTVKEMGPLPVIYRKAADGVFDIYQQGQKIFSVSRLLQALHNGVLPTYLVWILLGMISAFFILMR